jgi:hypothetical protein
MLFTLVTVLVLAATVLGLAFHRFWTTREEARSSLIYAEIAKRFFAWLALRTIQMARRASPQAWWAYLRGLPLWRAPVLEKWLFIGFYGSFLYLAASGFFFAVFVPRGLFGFPLVGHVMAGGLFAVCLTVVALFKGRDFIAAPRPVRLTWELLDPRKMGITAARVKLWAFWLFVTAGFLLTVSALLPMLPLLRTPGQKFMFEFHRYNAVLSALAAIVFAGLQLFEAPAGPADRGPEAPRT